MQGAVLRCNGWRTHGCSAPMSKGSPSTMQTTHRESSVCKSFDKLACLVATCDFVVGRLPP